MRIALIGYGNVARGLIDLLRTRRETLVNEFGFRPTITAIVARRGAAINPAGIEPGDEIRLDRLGVTFDQAIEHADVVCEVTPTDARTGGAGLFHCRAALAAGKHVVTANKGPLVVAYRELAQLARDCNVHFRYEGTVMGGTPVMVLGLETLKVAGIRQVRGIVNGTTNFILTQMEAGESYEAVLKRAQELGYAEADPTADVEGWDAAAKAAILANTLMGADLRIDDVQRTGITGITSDMILSAGRGGKRYKLIASVRREGDSVVAAVTPTQVPFTDPLAQVGGGMNALTFDLEAIGSVTLFGAGAGGKATGFALLADLLAIHRATHGEA